MSSVWLASAPASAGTSASLISQYSDKRSSLENGRYPQISTVAHPPDRAGPVGRLAARAAATLALAYLVLHAASSVFLLPDPLQASTVRSVDPVFLDLTRSHSHRTTIRPSISFQLNTLTSTGQFPEWYGRPSEAGSSPFDYSLPQEWKHPQRWIVVAPPDGTIA